MFDFAAARRMMVDGQVRPSDVTDLRIIGAMLDIAREQFVPAKQAELAYLDLDVPVGGSAQSARHLLKPMVLARLIQAAAVGEGDKVLDVAVATGYSSAVLSRLAGSVIALEEDPALVRAAREALSGFGNVTVESGPLAEGWVSQAPYDAILVNGAVEILRPALLKQLKPGGRLLCVVKSGPIGKAMLYRNTGDEVGGRAIFDASAPLLRDFIKPPVFAF